MQEKILSRIDKDPKTGCWNWTSCKDQHGYGRLSPSHKESVPAHRFSYEAFVGKIPKGLHIDHLCRNPSCVNPDHLDVVTPGENVRRGKRGVLYTHCPHGHEMTEENSYRLKSGKRECLNCRRRRGRDYWRRKNWGVAACLCLLFVSCAKKPIPGIETRILNPFEYGCKCLDLTDIQLGHFQLIGDKRWQDNQDRLHQCVEAGLLEGEDDGS